MLRDVLLHNAFGVVMITLYYQNTNEVVLILRHNMELCEKFKMLVVDNMDVIQEIIATKKARMSAEQADKLISFLDEIKTYGSPQLTAAIDFTVSGIEEGYLLKGIGIIVE
jgi:hypothetical protein